MGLLKKIFSKEDKEFQEKVASEKRMLAVFDDVLTIRKAIGQIKNILENGTLNIEERIKLEDKLPSYYETLEAVEKNMIDVKRGFYMGIGINLQKDDAKPEPIYLSKKDSNGHFGCQGQSGSGKTVSMELVLRQLSKMNDNFLVVDPKGGEGQEVLSAVLEALYEDDRLDDFIYVSPAHPELSDSCNLIYGMSNEERGAMLHKLASIGGSDKFFPDNVELATKAISSSFEFLEKVSDSDGERLQRLMKYELYKLHLKRQNKSIHKELNKEVQTSSEFSSIEEEIRQGIFEIPSDAEYINTWTLMTFRDLLQNSSFEKIETLHQLVQGTAISSDLDVYRQEELKKLKEEAQSLTNTVIQLGEQFYTKVASSFSLLLTQLSIGPIGEVLCGIRINPIEMTLVDPNKRLAVVIQPFPLKFKNTAGMMTKIFTMSFESIIGRVGASGRGKNARMHFVVDEASTAIYEGIEALFSMARGLELTLWMYTQSFADWERVLGKEGARVVMENMNTKSRMRMGDESSAKIVQEEIGKTATMVSSTMTGDSGGTVENRYVISKEEVYMIQANEIIKLRTGSSIMKIREDVYLVDHPYSSGPKGKIVMPELREERLIQTLIEIENSCPFENKVQSEVNYHIPGNFKIVEE